MTEREVSEVSGLEMALFMIWIYLLGEVIGFVIGRWF